MAVKPESHHRTHFSSPVKHAFYDTEDTESREDKSVDWITAFVKGVFVHILWDDFYHWPPHEKTRYVCAGRQFALLNAHCRWLREEESL